MNDRIALLLGRAIMRAESLQVALEEAQTRIADLEKNSDTVDSGDSIKKAGK